MDVSSEYIQMCDCEEVQGKWKPDDGDWAGEVYKSGQYKTYPHPICTDGMYDVKDYAKTAGKWLPRQDQIQEMMDIESGCWWTGYDRPHALLNQLIYGIGTDDGFPDEYYVEFRSLEQLWLAFFMKEKHSKTWDGKRWVGTGK